MLKTIPFLSLLCANALFLTVNLPTHARGAEVIELTQTGCQFLEPEKVDHQYVTRSINDCIAINKKTVVERLGKSETLILKPGEYQFKVINKNVPYELGFWLRSEGYNFSNPLHHLTKTSISGGGIFEGKSRLYTVTLKPGEYIYSCPLNTTPDYHIRVTEN